MTQDETRAALQAAGYQIGSYADFLGLTAQEVAEVEAQGLARDGENSVSGNGSAKNGSHHSEHLPVQQTETVPQR